MDINTVILGILGLLVLVILALCAKNFTIKAGDKEISLNKGGSSSSSMNLYQVIYSVLQAREDVGMTKRVLFDVISTNVERIISRETEEIALVLRQHEIDVCRNYKSERADIGSIDATVSFISVCCDYFRVLIKNRCSDVWKENHLSLKTPQEIEELKHSLFNVICTKYDTLLRDNWCKTFIPLDWLTQQRQPINEKLEKTTGWCIDRMQEGSKRKNDLRQLFAKIDEKLHLYMSQKGQTPSNLSKVLSQITADTKEIPEEFT